MVYKHIWINDLVDNFHNNLTPMMRQRIIIFSFLHPSECLLCRTLLLVLWDVQHWIKHTYFLEFLYMKYKCKAKFRYIIYILWCISKQFNLKSGCGTLNVLEHKLSHKSILRIFKSEVFMHNQCMKVNIYNLEVHLLPLRIYWFILYTHF